MRSDGPDGSTTTGSPAEHTRVVVIGAGAAGLSAAQLLAERHPVVVLDKGRGVGGRLATRRVGDATFDHGAQFVTTHGDEFAAMVQRWQDVGVAEPWYHGRVGPSGVADRDGHTRYRGAVSMNAVAKHLAAGLDVRTSRRVGSLAVEQGRWSVRLDDATTLTCDAVVATAPVPQTLELLAAGAVALADEDADELARIEYEPCLAVMLALDQPADLPEPGAVAPDDGVVDWLADNQAKGVSATPALTVHLGATASRDWWQDDDELVLDRTLEIARAVTGRPLGIVGHSVQRWRYARPRVTHPSPFLIASGLPPMVFVGDAFGEAKVEGAVCSGSAGARQLLGLLER